jgi:hypothetical protein
MAVSVHRDLNDLLMSWLADVYTPWNAVRWLGDASDRIPGVNDVRMSESLYRPTTISSNFNGCDFLVTCLWLRLAVSTQQLRFETPASSILTQHNMYCLAVWLQSPHYSLCH